MTADSRLSDYFDTLNYARNTSTPFEVALVYSAFLLVFTGSFSGMESLFISIVKKVYPEV